MKDIYVSSENPGDLNVLLGSIGTATKTPPESMSPSSAEACVANWHITLDGSSPDEKRNYGLSTVHLRDVRGHAPAKKLDPNSTHEVTLWPLRETPLSDVENPASWEAETPVAQTQFQNLTDEQADMITTFIADGCVNGDLPVPNSGEWIKWGPYIQALFERNMPS